MSTISDRPRPLTRKGMATRARIVESAARLIYERGVRETSNEMIRAAAGVSGSQLSHYFPDKEALLRGVIAYRADHMRGRLSDPPRGPLDSIEALERWAEGRITNEAIVDGGCSFGSLSSEILKSEPELHDAIAEGFALWLEDFRSGLEAMRARGDLREDADIDHLAHVLATAFQGGMLLAQAERDVAPLRDALGQAIDAVRALAPDDQTRLTRQAAGASEASAAQVSPPRR